MFIHDCWPQAEWNQKANALRDDGGGGSSHHHPSPSRSRARSAVNDEETKEAECRDRGPSPKTTASGKGLRNFKPLPSEASSEDS